MLAVQLPQNDDLRRDLLDIGADMALFYDYWNRKRGRRRMPARCDLDPVDMKHHLPGVMLVEVVPDAREFVYRLVGTREATMRGRDPTGKSVPEEFFADSAESAFRCYRKVVAEGAPLVSKNRDFMTPDGRFGREHSVLLPLSDDQVHVSMILVYTHHVLR